MAKKGRPFVYQSEDEKPVTISLRLPRDLYDQVDRYVKMRPGMTLTEFFLDGARLRLDIPADPRDIILSDDNTVIQELEAMVEAAVQRALAKERTTLPALATSTPALVPETPTQPVADLSYNGNAVLQKKAPRRRGRPDTMRQRILTLLREHPEGLSAEHIRAFLQAEKPLGDTLQGMRRACVVTTQGEGKDTRYFVA
jgi:hypothetical protein